MTASQAIIRYLRHDRVSVPQLAWTRLGKHWSRSTIYRAMQRLRASGEVVYAGRVSLRGRAAGAWRLKP